MGAMDTIETIDGALVQHGPHNDRIYLMQLHTADPYRIAAALDVLGRREGYGKIFAKIPAPAWPAFESAGYVREAEVPGFYNGRTSGYFIAKYLRAERRRIAPGERPSAQFAVPGGGPDRPVRHRHDAQRPVIACRTADAHELSRIYRRVFKTYPFPVHRADYLKRMMKEGVRYFAVRVEGRLAAAAAAEVARREQYAEMTDFATLPGHRGRGLAGRLLRHMEKRVRTFDVKTAFTIARAASPGMNAVFRKHGYRYAGLLRNNTQISGRLESMAVWYKPL
jgi:putative beta-lysine N-acetyltransferase